MFYRCSKEEPDQNLACDRKDDCFDLVSAQTAAQQTVQSLIAAQEKELSSIARELHDDICQRLAMLAMKIEKVAKGWAAGRRQVGVQLEQIWQLCSDLTSDVQALSHQLHPSILDNLGLVTAARSFCREFCEDNGTIVEFTDENIPNDLPREVSLSLFRVIQEAIHNAAKYSGETRFTVHLQGRPGEIELEVVDLGVGCDVTGAKRAAGLGLVSMTERIRLLNGSISIESKPNAGTRIRARVPLATPAKAHAAVN